MSGGTKRKALMQSVDRVLGGAASESRMNLTGQMNLFSAPDDGGQPADTTQLVLPDVEEFTRAELIAMERETTGLYLTGHPMDDYRALAQQAKAAPMGDILASFHAPATAAHRYRDGQRVVLAGICTASRERATRKNTRMAYLQLEDDSGSMEVLVFSPALDAARPAGAGKPRAVRGRAHLDAGRIRPAARGGQGPAADGAGARDPAHAAAPRPAAAARAAEASPALGAAAG